MKPVSCMSAALGPRGSSIAIELLRDSTPHQLLETAMIVFVPSPAQGTIHLIELLDVFSICTQKIPSPH